MRWRSCQPLRNGHERKTYGTEKSKVRPKVKALSLPAWLLQPATPGASEDLPRGLLEELQTDWEKPFREIKYSFINGHPENSQKMEETWI